MIDFKPSDEVVCINDTSRVQGHTTSVKNGRVYVVEALVVIGCGLCAFSGKIEPERVTVILAGLRSKTLSGGFSPARFRKVTRPRTSLTIESFLTIKTGQFEEKKRVTPGVPVREGAK